MPIFFKVVAPTICSLLLIGCAHNIVPNETPREAQLTVQSQALTLWHDGSKGGAYGVGEGWSIELIPATYRTMSETVMVSVPNVENGGL